LLCNEPEIILPTAGNGFTMSGKWLGDEPEPLMLPRRHYGIK
jgi:hypothetical protein